MKTITRDTDKFTLLGAFSVQAPKTGLCGGSVTPTKKSMPCMDFLAGATASRPSNPLRTNRERLRRKDRRVLRAPVELVLSKAGFRGSPCRLDTNNTLNVSRAALGAPVGLNLRKTVFGGSPCRLYTNNTLNVSRAGSRPSNPLRTNRGQTLRVCFLPVAQQNARLVSETSFFGKTKQLVRGRF
jgi:hypothetical protein